MTNQQGAPEAPSYEHQRAIMEGERNASLDAYSRVVYLTQTESRIYEAGFTNGWNRLAALVEAQQPAAHVQNPAEIEHVAGDVSKNGPESNMAQQPAPSAAVASKAVLAAIRAANLQLVRTGDDAFMLVTYKNAKAQCDGGQCGIGGYCDDCPTPKADSQPAPDEVADAMADSQYLAGVSAGWNAANADDPNAALQKLHESRAGYLKPLSAARAPADSVTAPAGGPAMPAEFLRGVIALCTQRGYSPENIEAWSKDDKWIADLWRQAERLLAAAPTPPAQAADSVLEDAARYRWLRQEHERVDPVCHLTWKRNLQRDSSEWVNTAVLDTAIDKARKQGGA